jgi:hypothetical protein
VTDTRTGRAVASQKPLPGTTFSGVAGAPDDRTFVVDQIPFGQRGGTGAHAWYLLRFTPGSPGTVKRTGLGSLTEPASTQTLGFAVSPNGRMLAVLSQPGAGATLGPVTLQISSLVSGLPFTWTSPKPGSGGLFDLDNLATISWLSDNRRLAFQSAYLPRPRTIFLLDTFGHGHALFGDSKAVFTMPRSEATCLDALLAPDGRTAFCAGASSPGSHPGEVAITAYSTATGKPQRVLYRARMGAGELFWAGSRAQAIVLMLGHPSAKNPKQLTNVIGVITPGKFAPFPIAMGAAGYSYGLIAF